MPPLLRLLRPLNLVLSLVGIAVGGILAVGGDVFQAPASVHLLLAMASGALVGAASNACNDIMDADIDRHNRPDRPVASGAVTPEAARAVWIVLSIVGVGLGGLVSWGVGAVAFGSALLLWLYNVRLKGTPGWGNLVVAFVIALALVYGALAVGAFTATVAVGVGMTFLITLAREIVKDVEDVEGDGAEGARTLAVVKGEWWASRLALGLVLLTLVLLPLPSFTLVGRTFLAYGLVCAGCLLAAIWALATADRTTLPQASSSARGWLKGAMAAGVLALALARLGN
jgi:geranylgeranylglycerol-phosphate geranylgeranyltransferase